MEERKKANKVGIITHYYGSTNYGGCLQAYALCRYLKEQGLDVEQISYQVGVEALSEQQRVLRVCSLMLRPKRFINALKNRSMGKVRQLLDLWFCQDIKHRNSKFDQFREKRIPHSRVYTAQTIDTCKDYDVFITGSDQVWNPDWYEPAYYLSFVPAGGRKISYAASLCVTKLTEAQSLRLRKDLASFSAISVREKDAVNLVQPHSRLPVQWVLDPTLLLTKTQWDEICTDRLIKEKYAFAYFLGGDKDQRKLAREVAKEKGLLLVTLPYLLGHFRGCDRAFGDQQLYDISPEEFLSLIKYAEVVLTDSFHGAAFSCLYQKEFFAFQRQGSPGMGSRLYSLLELFECENHFCTSIEKLTIKELLDVDPINYRKEFLKFDMVKDQSTEYLKICFEK